MIKLPDIFNDVIGPVMRGPSSSHTAASWRIARTALNILNDKLEFALVEFDRNGAWAPNFREQGTTLGIDGGLLGLEITDEQIKSTESLAIQLGITIEYRVSSFPTNHANTVKLTLKGISQKEVKIVAVSTGGGAFEIQSVDGFKVNLTGDLYGLILFVKGKTTIQEEFRNNLPEGIKFLHQQNEDSFMYEFKSSKAFPPEFINMLKTLTGTDDISIINPVMPIISGKQTEIPFNTVQSLLDYAEKTEADLGDLGLLYETCLSGLLRKDLNKKMSEIIEVIHQSIDTGLKGTKYEDRILQQQSHLIEKAEKDSKIKNQL
ncbi:MAG: hypothetical protein R3182_08680, partial [Draconibacterium sp.]|nr:hypothetical protein [Draconibacterium sp.]